MENDKHPDFSVFNSSTGGICRYPLHSEAATRPDTQVGVFILVLIQQEKKKRVKLGDTVLITFLGIITQITLPFKI